MLFYPNFLSIRIARIDPKVSQDCQIQTGDALKISSEKTDTIALSWPARQDDYGKWLMDTYEISLMWESMIGYRFQKL